MISNLLVSLLQPLLRSTVGLDFLLREFGVRGTTPEAVLFLFTAPSPYLTASITF